MQSIENTGSDADFATVYSLVAKIDDVLLSKTIYDEVSTVQPLRSNVALPFLPASAFTSVDEKEIIQQFEFNVDPSKYPAPYNDGNATRMYDLFLAIVYGAFPPIFQCSFIANIENITDDSSVAAIHGGKCLEAQDYMSASPAACSADTTYTVATSGKEWAQNMVRMDPTTLVDKAYCTNEWKAYSAGGNPLPDKIQYNSYFIASESPCNGDCIISRLCYWTDTGEIVETYPIEGDESDGIKPMGGSLASPNPEQLAAEQQNTEQTYSTEAEDDKTTAIAPVPVCGLQAVYPKYYSAYSTIGDLLLNNEVNIYNPSILNSYCSEYDPERVTASEFADQYATPYEGENAKYEWIPVSMCNHTYDETKPEEAKVAIRINKFKTITTIVENDTIKVIDKYISLPTALRIKLKGKYRPAIRKVWYDAIFQTLRHCMGYLPSGESYSNETTPAGEYYSDETSPPGESHSAETFALGNTWDTSIHTLVQDCANYGAMAYYASEFYGESSLIKNYKETNWLDLWMEQYLLGRKGLICESNDASGNADSYEEAGGLCVTSVEHQAQQNPSSKKYCQYAYTKEKLHLPWHGGCANALCVNNTEENTPPEEQPQTVEEEDTPQEEQPSGDLAAHGYTFNILNDLYDTILNHKIAEIDLCNNVKVLDMGFDIESYAYSNGDEASFSTGNYLLEIYKTYGKPYSDIDFNNEPHFLLIREMLYSALQSTYPLLNPGVYIKGPTCRDPVCYEYTHADIYFYSAGSFVHELVVNADIVADEEYSAILQYSTEGPHSYITTNPEDYVWLDSTIKYHTASVTSQQFKGSCDTAQGDNDPSEVVTEVSTFETSQNTYSIKLNPKNVLPDPSKWVPSNYHIYVGIPILTRMERVRITLSGCDELLSPAWEIGMLARKPVEPLPSNSQVFTKIDWVWLTDKGTETKQTIAELPQEYYSMLLSTDVYTPSELQLNVLQPRAYGMFKCITSPYVADSLNTDEKWYPLYKSEGGYTELRAVLLKNGNSATVTSKTYNKSDTVYSIDVLDSTTHKRQFYGLIALDIIVHPYGDPTTGDAALASFGAEALRTSMDSVMNWEMDYEQGENSTERVEQGNIKFRAYSATPNSTGCIEIYDFALQESKGIKIEVSSI